ncbi:hypothetical protein ABLG96_16325 [Nakamurella sp. A5-74]|uniref:Uncharacterized protein n=1 Tax=Nakamurella sp. A5-74 TaxID=3158264 RepID=A0AAU8DLA7_9ACTN
MRVYIPSTVTQLRTASDRGSVPATVGFGVTASLRSEYPAAEEDELEYLAMTDAARASLRLLAGEDGAGGADGGHPAAGVRVVIAADVDAVTEYPQGDRAAVRVDAEITWRQVAAVHLDGADAADAVRAAVAVVDEADLDDPDAEFVVGEAESYELAWYAPDEIRFLLEELG